MTKTYCPRLSINISEDQQLALRKYLPWGTQSKVFGVILDDLLELCRKNGSDKVLGAYLGRYIKLEELSGLEKDFSNGNNL